MYLKFLLLLFLCVNLTCADHLQNNDHRSRSSHLHRGHIRRRDSESTTPKHEDLVEESDTALLHRINDRLTSLIALDEQQLRRLEALEYKITRTEVQTLEKVEAMQAEVKELTRRMQQIDWQSSKTDATLDSIKTDTTYLKDSLDQRLTQGVAPRPTRADNDVSNRLSLLTTSLTALRGGISSLQNDLTTLNRNVTLLTNKVDDLSLLSQNLVSKQYLNSAVLDLKHTPQMVTMLPSSNPQRRTFKPEAAALDIPEDCLAVQERGHNASGVYRIRPPGSTDAFFVFCDLEHLGGGWTVLHNRVDGNLDFYRDYRDYKQGFGNLGGEHWLGLDKLYQLTGHKINEALIELKDFDNVKKYAHYGAFGIGPETSGYAINLLGGYEGDAGDSLTYHAGQKFSTHDNDNDNWPEGSCAKSHHGAWWYNGCDASNLNGQYLNGLVGPDQDYHGMYWYEFRGPNYSLMAARILVRPAGAKPWKSQVNPADRETYSDLMSNQGNQQSSFRSDRNYY